jgi:hypothetical protein
VALVFLAAWSPARAAEPVRAHGFEGRVSSDYDGPRPGDPDWPGARTDAPEACLTCHGSIENAMEQMSEGFALRCTFCHGGDPQAATKEAAHVQPTLPVIMDRTVPPLDYDLPYQMFVNPSNLRVVDYTCGWCHWAKVREVWKSLMATAAGHYAGGLYQNGVVDTKTPIYGTFAVIDDDGIVPEEQGAVESLEDLLIYDPTNDPELFSTHFQAVPSQACARCHLWSRGKGYRGAVGAEGVYRADGCAACHMPYADDGLSRSNDPSIDHEEPGHPRNHTITKAIPTEQCLHCHHRGARIGLSYTGRAQMPPRLPSGPGVPGTTDVRFNGNYHYTDAETNPQDIHGARGLHCIDCHKSSEIMGDGNIYGHIDQATKIECQTCHGTPTEEATLLDNDGLPLWNVEREEDGTVVVRSKVDDVQSTRPSVRTSPANAANTGTRPTQRDRRSLTAQRPPTLSGPATLRPPAGPKRTRHEARQVMEIIDPTSTRFNPSAAEAMNADHLKSEGGLECHACHTSWTPNCFGCHFERDERRTGLNLMTGEMEVGKASTNNKIFEALRYFMMGPNASGRIATYIVGCQPIADVTAPDGSKILDFAMPYTANGLSGLALQPVHPHTVRGRGEVRTCAECHRAPPTLGFGSGNYSLARKLAFVAGDAGVVVFDRHTDPTNPAPVGILEAGRPVALATVPDVIEGTAEFVYVASGEDGLFVFDMRDGFPDGPAAVLDGIDAIDVTYRAGHLYVVVEGFGVEILDGRDPASFVPVATVPVPGALRAVPWGIHLLVAAGEDGLVVVDISDHHAPAVAGTLGGFRAVDVAPYAHYRRGNEFASRAYVADPGFGIRVVDLLPDFSDPSLVGGLPLAGASALDTYTRYVPAHGDVPSREHDYLYAAAGEAGLGVFDITDPDAIAPVASVASLGGSAGHLQVSSQMAPPGVDDYVLLAGGESGLQVIDVTDPQQPSLVATVEVPGASHVLVEVQQLDRFLDEQGNPLKENSHPGVGLLSRADIVRILGACISPGCTTD